jgi:hypothetical protein
MGELSADRRLIVIAFAKVDATVGQAVVQQLRVVLPRVERAVGRRCPRIQLDHPHALLVALGARLQRESAAAQREIDNVVLKTDVGQLCSNIGLESSSNQLNNLGFKCANCIRLTSFERVS